MKHFKNPLIDQAVDALREAGSLPLFAEGESKITIKINPPPHKNQAAFDRFHRDNPRVYLYLVGKARIAKQHGRKKYAIKALIELFRWHTTVETSDGDFKISNNHAPFYARLIMKENPDLEDFFRISEQKE